MSAAEKLAPAPEAQPCEVPPFVGDRAALVIVDWSWWLHKAWVLGELDMLSHVVGWLCAMLAHRPAHVCIALDAPGRNTRRDHLRHPTDEAWRYKANRPPKPAEFSRLCDKATDIAALHSIPILWAPNFEGDDVIATAAAKARAAGYRVVLCTADKDLHGLCAATPREGAVVLTWDPFQRWWRGPEHVRAKWGVEPAQMADLLAIWGDAGDSVPGVAGLGLDKAAAILKVWGTLDAALSEPAYDEAALGSLDKSIRDIDKMRKKMTGDALETALDARAAIMRRRAVERDRVKLQAAADLARFSRDLTALDCDAPISMPWTDLPLGGFDVEALVARYDALGFSDKARRVADMAFPKPAPWSVPW